MRKPGRASAEPRIHWLLPITVRTAVLAGGGLRLLCLRRLLHLRKNLANGFVGSWAALFSPGLQAIALRLQVAEEVRAPEHGAPRADHRHHLFPDNPLSPVAFEEQLSVDQPAVPDAGHHPPGTPH